MITAVKFDSDEVMTAFISMGDALDKPTTSLAMALYEAANKYEGATRQMERYAERITESAAKLVAGDVPFYPLAQDAAEMEKLSVQRASAKEYFELTCKLFNLEIIK